MALIEPRWRNLGTKLGLRGTRQEFIKIEKRYRERHRKYHNARHINDCLTQLDPSSHEGAKNPLWIARCGFMTRSTTHSLHELRSAE
jgi:predicted metal-dependent HD superfamily phosphohydrolase